MTDQIFNCLSRMLFVKYLGHFCTTPESSFFSFLSHCNENHEHSRMLIVDKKNFDDKIFSQYFGKRCVYNSNKPRIIYIWRASFEEKNEPPPAEVVIQQPPPPQEVIDERDQQQQQQQPEAKFWKI